MRYELGQDYPFVEIDFTDDDNRPTFSQAYRPWEHRLTHMGVRRLTCLSHHRVRGAYEAESVEPSHDGFVFSDRTVLPAEETIWYNQYPVANYSQTSTQNDHLVWRPEGLRQMTDALHYLKCLQRIVWRMQQHDAQKLFACSADQLWLRRAGLNVHLAAIRLMVEQVMGRRIEFRPISIAGRDLDGWFEACMV